MARHHPDAGPTGDFPRGKLDPTDRGGINVAIAGDPRTRTVILDLGPVPVQWMAIHVDEVEALIAAIRAKAAVARGDSN